MASLTSLEIAAKQNISKHSASLEEKSTSLTSVINACERSIAMIRSNSKDYVEQLNTRRDEQIKEICRKYDELEGQLMQTSKTVVNELSSFIEESVKPQRGKVERASELLNKTFESDDQAGIINLNKNVDQSLQKIVNAKLPVLRLSRLFELKSKDEWHREPEFMLVDSHGSQYVMTNESEKKQLAFEGDYDEVDKSQVVEKPQVIEQPQDIEKPQKIKKSQIVDNSVDCRGEHPSSPHDSPPQSIDAPAQSADTSPGQSVAVCQLPVSFSKSILQCKISGFSSHIAQGGRNVYVADSFEPVIYKINEKNEPKRVIPVEQSLTVIGLAASQDLVHVQYMDVTEYQRVIYTYNVSGEFLRKWDTPNLLGASLVLVDDDIVISSRSKVTVCSSSGQLIKTIALSPRCVRKMSALSPDSVIISSSSINQVMKLNIRTEKICWTNTLITSPVATACDKFGRVYVLAKPASIYVLSGQTGEVLTESTLSCAGGVMEDLCITANGLLITAINYKTKSNDSCSYSVVNTFCIEGVC